jgi:plasmid stabilization system protein ParE
MKTLFLSEKAYDDLLQILRYIARDKPQVAERFVDQLVLPPGLDISEHEFD